MTDGRTEAIAISPTLFLKKRGDNYITISKMIRIRYQFLYKIDCLPSFAGEIIKLYKLEPKWNHKVRMSTFLYISQI